MSGAIIHVVNSADENYVPHVGAMLVSLFKHNDPLLIHFHFLHTAPLPTTCLEQLEGLCDRFGANFEAVCVDDGALDKFPVNERFPVEAWFRVILPDLLPDLDRVLWLDADTLVLDSIAPLWELELGEAPLAACPNPVLYSFRSLIDELEIEDRSKYFNSGVMILDLAKLRSEGSTGLLTEIGHKYRQWIRFADQDVLNVAYINRYKPLNMKWNVLTHSYLNVPETVRVFGRTEYRAAIARPSVVHFTGNLRYKPWSYKCGHPYRDEYLACRGEAGWPIAEFEDASFRNWIVRNLPLRLRSILETLAVRRFGEMMSYIRQWD